MTIHYRNAQGRMIFLDKVHHIQNLDNKTLIIVRDGKEIAIRVAQIEGIWHEDTKTAVIN